ncbi:flagellar hook-basal body complex protein FliE [Roseomonas sp. PWR1]|jgi:flagellar hook-basal body complex protein FliE|uniref:Flagellar hook-basal body complex protein FliE n=2 Tax=Acetobacterales TaxID=3120395 RepID=A0ABS4B002_9PROT|nr:flagellar hook-basal body complex protein FliE [Neoroseomonas nitratireducens]MBP0466882.1 flagellar hook-basal body complex protein FliE [Neoroseomonas nitratireducens]
MTIALAPAGAAAAYRAADALPGAATGGTGGAGFGAALTRAMEQAVEVGREADATTTRALTGQGSVTDVVLAVGRAELTLQTAVAVRDRVVAAYQDVMRMPI